MPMGPKGTMGPDGLLGPHGPDGPMGPHEPMGPEGPWGAPWAHGPIGHLMGLVKTICPGALQNRSGTCLNASGLFFASNLHVQMGKTIRQSIRSELFGIFTILGVLSPAPRGNTFAKKRTQNEKRKSHKNIKFFKQPKYS